jgi:hypothetical protein
MSSKVIALVAISCIVRSTAVAQVASYRVEFLGSGTTASALNELGVAVGSMKFAGDVTSAAIAYPDQPFVPLPLPAGYLSSTAYDINDSGLVVGVVSTSTVPNMSAHAAAWRPTPNGYVIDVLGEPVGDLHSYATGVNNHGDIVGSSGIVPWAYVVHAVHFASNGPVILPGLSSEVADVNDNRQVLARNELFDLTTGQIQIIGLPPGIWQGFGGAALNELDGFCGYIQGNSSTCASFPMRYLPSSGWLTVGGCAQTTSATAINDRGDVLTYVYFSAARVRLEGIGDFPIGQLIDPSQGNWLVQWYGASDINNARQILCSVQDPTSTEIGAARLTSESAVTGFCFGDGSLVACPCGNNGASGNGCANSFFPGGGRLRGLGVPTVAADSMVLEAQDLSGNVCVFFQGDGQSAPSAIDDGLGCVAGALIRLGTKSVVGATAIYPGPGDLSVSVKGAVGPLGGTRYYQAFYRNAAPAFCPPATTNRTNGLIIVWSP